VTKGPVNTYDIETLQFADRSLTFDANGLAPSSTLVNTTFKQTSAHGNIPKVVATWGFSSSSGSFNAFKLSGQTLTKVSDQ
jgi:hypothetical protein